MKRNQRVRRSAAALFIALLLAGLVSACGDDSSDADGDNGDNGTSEPGEDLTGKTIAWISCAPVVPFCANLNKAFVENVEARGGTVREYVSNYDPAEQAQQLNQALTQNVDSISIVTFAQASLRPGLLQAKQQGVPVSFVGTPADPDIEADDLFTTYVGPDDFATGKEQAELMIAGIKETGKTSGNIVVLNSTTGQTSADRGVAGFEEGVAAADGFEIVGSGDTDYDPTKAGPLLTQLLNQNRAAGVDGVWIPPGGALVQPAILAAEQAGFEVGVDAKGLILVSKGCTAVTNTIMRDGLLYGDSALTVPALANPAADTAIKLALGEEVGKSVDVIAPSFTVADIDKHAAECELS